MHAYTYMLAKSADEFSSYSPSFFARELVSGADSVVSWTADGSAAAAHFGQVVKSVLAAAAVQQPHAASWSQGSSWMMQQLQ